MLIRPPSGGIIFNEAINRRSREPVRRGAAVSQRDDGQGQPQELVASLIRTLRQPRHGERARRDQDLGFQYATRSGITIAVSDIKVPDAKTEMLAEADAEVSRIEQRVTAAV